METLKVDLEQDEVFVFTPKGQVITLPNGRHADRLRLLDPHRGRARVHRRAGQRPAGAARLEAARRATRSRSSRRRSRAPAPSRDWLKIVATPRAANKIRQWFSRERREDAIENGRDELIKALRREGLPVQKIAAVEPARRGRDDAELRRPRRAARRRSARTTCRPSRSRRASRKELARRRTRARGAAADHRAPAARLVDERPATRCARRGARRRDGAAVALLHAGARRRDHGLRHPRPRRVGAPRRLRQRRVAGRRARATASSRSSGTPTSPACSSPRSR